MRGECRSFSGSGHHQDLGALEAGEVLLQLMNMFSPVNMSPPSLLAIPWHYNTSLAGKISNALRCCQDYMGHSAESQAAKQALMVHSGLGEDGKTLQKKKGKKLGRVEKVQLVTEDEHLWRRGLKYDLAGLEGPVTAAAAVKRVVGNSPFFDLGESGVIGIVLNNRYASVNYPIHGKEVQGHMRLLPSNLGHKWYTAAAPPNAIVEDREAIQMILRNTLAFLVQVATKLIFSNERTAVARHGFLREELPHEYTAMCMEFISPDTRKPVSVSQHDVVRIRNTIISLAQSNVPILVKCVKVGDARKFLEARGLPYSSALLETGSAGDDDIVLVNECAGELSLYVEGAPLAPTAAVVRENFFDVNLIDMEGGSFLPNEVYDTPRTMSKRTSPSFAICFPASATGCCIPLDVATKHAAVTDAVRSVEQYRKRVLRGTRALPSNTKPHGMECIGDLNRFIQMSTGKQSDFSNVRALLSVQEEMSIGAIREISDIVLQNESISFLFVCGPSTSGKTTLTAQIASCLEATEKVHVGTLSTDDYYKSIHWDSHPRYPDGRPNFETPDALRLDLLSENLATLLEGKTAQCPIFDMSCGSPKPDDFRYVSLAPSGRATRGVLIMEGIFSLHPRILEGTVVSANQKLNILVTPFPIMNYDETRFCSNQRTRIYRRTCRDYLNRGRDARTTLSGWRGVRDGEERNIVPFIDTNVDVVFDSFALYELPVLRSLLVRHGIAPFATQSTTAGPPGLLEEVGSEDVLYPLAHQLVAELQAVHPLHGVIAQSTGEDGEEEPHEVLLPCTALIREFVGGSVFE